MPKAKTVGYEHYKGPVSGLGAILLVIGIIWLAKDMGWIPSDLPIWPALLIAIGIVLLINKARYRK